MIQYSNDFRFEDAMNLRDRIKTIEKSQIKSGIDLTTNEDIDILQLLLQTKSCGCTNVYKRWKIASSSHDF